MKPTDALRLVRRKFDDAKNWVKCRTLPEHMYHWVSTGLEPAAWYDADARMLHACFSLLCSFVEEEHGGEDKLAEWSKELRAETDESSGWREGCVRQADRLDEALALYQWWKYDLPADERRRDDLLHDVYGQDIFDRVPVGDKFVEMVHKEMPPEWHEKDKAFRELDTKIDNDEQAMLHRLIEIRQSLWT